MKTQEFKLDFKKQSLVELNDSELNDVNGGSSPGCYAVSFIVSFGLALIYDAVKD